jgi:hypothetical protein
MEVTAWGDGGFFAMQATCITDPKTPATTKEVNHVTKLYAAPGSSLYYATGVRTYSSMYETYTLPQSVVARRSYDDNEEKAFLLSCYTEDMTTDNFAVQLDSISGSTGSSGDMLKVTAVDSGLTNEYYNGSAVSQSFNLTNDTTTFGASSQYYVTWSSDSVAESSTGMSITFYCTKTAWAISGAGVEVAADAGAVADGASVLSSVLTAVVVMVTTARLL